MSSTSSNHQRDEPNTGEPPRLQGHQNMVAAETTTDIEPRPEIPRRSPNRPRPESQPIQTEDGTMGPGLGGSAGQSCVLQTDHCHNPADNCRLNLEPNHPDTTPQAHEIETTGLGDSGSMNAGEHDRPIEEAPPPAYSEHYGEVATSQDGFDTQARVASVYRFITSEGTHIDRLCR